MSRLPSRMPAGLLGMIILLGIVDAGIERVRLDHRTPDTWDWRLSRAAAMTRVRECRVLCFGDSLAKLAVAPQVIEARTDLRAYNLAVVGGQAPSSYVLLRRALDSGARPEAVLVTFHPPMLRASPKFNRDQWPHLLGLGDGVALGWAAGDPELSARVVLGAALPAVRNRQAIRGDLIAAFRGEVNPWADKVPPFWRNWALNRGAQLMRSNPGWLVHRTDFDAWRRDVFPDWSCDPANVAYLRRFLALTSARGIRVYWLLPPYMPGLQAECEASGIAAAHERFVREWQVQFPNVTVLDGRRSAYDPATFLDPAHLGRDGAARFSADVADVLRRARRGPGAVPRWVHLPPYRPGSVGVALEDLHESTLALRSGRTSGPRPAGRN
jgi:hypothetical protein